MRILLLGEYSNVHATLAKGLREMGHEVTVVSNGDFWKDYPRDIDVSRPAGRVGGLRLLARVYALLPRLKGYDIVQLINPMFLELKARRLFPVYRYLRRHNRKVVLCAMGMDYYWVNECLTRRPLRYSDFNIGQTLRTDAPAMEARRDWLATDKEKLNRMMAHDCDAIVAGLYEYYVCYQPHFADKLQFIPLPIVSPASSQFSPLTSQLSPLTSQLKLLRKGVKHVLTHRILLADFYLMETAGQPVLPDGYQWVSEDELDRYGVPRLVEMLFEAVAADADDKDKTARFLP